MFSKKDISVIFLMLKKGKEKKCLLKQILVKPIFVKKKYLVKKIIKNKFIKKIPGQNFWSTNFFNQKKLSEDCVGLKLYWVVSICPKKIRVNSRIGGLMPLPPRKY